MSIRAWAAKMAPYCLPSLALTASWLSRVSAAACVEGLAQTRSISSSTLVGVDEALGNAEPFGVQHQGRTDGDAGRNGDAAFDFHAGATMRSPRSVRTDQPWSPVRSLLDSAAADRLALSRPSASVARFAPRRRSASRPGRRGRPRRRGPPPRRSARSPAGRPAVIRSRMLLPLALASVPRHRDVALEARRPAGRRRRIGRMWNPCGLVMRTFAAVVRRSWSSDACADRRPVVRGPTTACGSGHGAAGRHVPPTVRRVV